MRVIGAALRNCVKPGHAWPLDARPCLRGGDSRLNARLTATYTDREHFRAIAAGAQPAEHRDTLTSHESLLLAHLARARLGALGLAGSARTSHAAALSTATISRPASTESQRWPHRATRTARSPNPSSSPSKRRKCTSRAPTASSESAPAATSPTLSR